MKLKDKKYTTAQRIGRVERVLSQLYLTSVSLTKRIDELEKHINNE